MAHGIPFHGANTSIDPPPGDQGTISPLPLYRSRGGANVSCWQLDPEELEEVSRTGRVFLSVFSGRVFYPVYVGSEREVHRLVADTGPTFERTPDELQPPSRRTFAFRLSGEVLAKAHELDGGVEIVCDGPGSIVAHIVPGDVAGVQAIALPIDVDQVRNLVRDVREFLDEEDRNAASSCGLFDRLRYFDQWLEAAEVAGGFPARKHEA